MKKIILIIYSITLLLVGLITTSDNVYAVENDVIIGPNVLYKQTTAIVTINDIKLLYDAPGYILSVKTDNYTGNGNKVGNYIVQFEATNGVATITRDIVVKVVLELGNVTLVGDNNFYVRTDQVLNFDSIKETLRNINYIQMPVGTAQQMINDTYTGKEAITGVYDFSFRLISPSGVIQTVETKIYVADDFTNFTPIQNIPKEEKKSGSFFESLAIVIAVIIVISIVIKFAFKTKNKRKFR